MTNILIPTDFSDNSWNAIVFALSFFKDCKCNFYLMHVIDNRQGTVTRSNPSPADFAEKRIQLQELILKIEASPLKQNHVFFSLVTAGTIIESIRNEVADKHIDMIVMGTKGNSGIKKIVIGSNTTDVINKVKCTTLVIPEKARFTAIKNIALPTDYNIFFGAKILETLSALLKMFDAQIHIAHLAKKKEIIAGEQLQNKEILHDFFSDNRHNFLSVTNKNLDLAIQECVDKQHINLIAMVARNIHFFQQLFFSSNHDLTSYQKDIPFLVLHE
jgi:nucleotide-binding universal stress UspA family protein